MSDASGDVERATAERAAADQAATADKERQRLLLTDATAQAASDAQARVRAVAAALEREREAAVALEREASAARQRTAFRASDDDTLLPHGDQHGDATSFEALAVANLHAQVAGVQNIRALVPVVLDPSLSHYNKWRDLVLLTLGRYSLADHVTTDAIFPDNPAWHRMDCVVLSWIYGTVSPELMDVVRVHGNTTRTAWLGIEHQFLGNRETRALHLDAEFRTFAQGDLSITEYYRKMKSMADALADLGEYIPDRTLVLKYQELKA